MFASMLSLRLLLLAIVLLSCSSSTASASNPFFHRHDYSHSPHRHTSQPPTIDDLPPDWQHELEVLIQNVTRCGNVVGLGVNIVLANTSIYSRGFGATSRETMQPVTEHTLFSVGSTTKAFTSTLLAMLIDEGVLSGWDEKVANIAKDWQFDDSTLTKYMSIRDLLAMKSGLSIQALLFLKNQTRTDILYKYQHAPSSWEMRTFFQYHNQMIDLAGHLAEILTGDSWEDLIQKRLLDPLGMQESTPYLEEARRSSNRAQPYMIDPYNPKRVVPVPIEMDDHFQKVGPAGSMSLTAHDAARWLIFQLNRGSIDNTTLVSSNVLNECHQPSFLVEHPPQPASKPRAPFSEASMGYGFGWMKENYQGYEAYWHNGLLWGYNSEMYLMPDIGLGIFLSQTGSIAGENTIAAIRYYIINLVLGLDNSWIHADCPQMDQEMEQGVMHDQNQEDQQQHPRPGVFSAPGPTAAYPPGLAPTLPTSAQAVSIIAQIRRQSKMHAHPHSHRHHAPTSLRAYTYEGTYSNIMYDQLSIRSASELTDSEEELRKMFPAYSPTSASAPITLILEWECLTIGLAESSNAGEDGDHLLFDGYLSSPWDIVLAPIIPKSVYFVPSPGQSSSGDIQSMWWIVDGEQPPLFEKVQDVGVSHVAEA